jgi:hypothetical protein
MVDRRTYTSWLAFLNTVRTERFDEVVGMNASLKAISLTVRFIDVML